MSLFDIFWSVCCLSVGLVGGVAHGFGHVGLLSPLMVDEQLVVEDVYLMVVCVGCVFCNVRVVVWPILMCLAF